MSKLTTKKSQISVKEALPVYELLNNAKISSLDTTDLMNVVKNIKNIRDIVAAFDELKLTVLEKLKDSNFNDMIAKRRNEGVTPEVKEYFDDYNAKCIEALTDDYTKLHDVELKEISEDGISKLIKENNWTPAQALILLK